MRDGRNSTERYRVNQLLRWGIALPVICAVMFASAASGSASSFTVDWRASALSLTAEKADLLRVLEEVQAKTGLEVQGLERLQSLPEDSRKISVSFENLPLADGLHKLLSGFNFGLAQYLEPKPGTTGTTLYVIGQASAPLYHEGEGRDGSLARGLSATVRAQDELGIPITHSLAPGQGSIQARPSLRDDERRANSIVDMHDGVTVLQPDGTSAVTVNVEDQSGASVMSTSSERRHAASPARVLSDERKPNEHTEPQNARP